MAENLDKLCSSVFCKVELLNDKIRYLAEEIAKQNVDDAAWFLLDDYSKTDQERNKLKKELLSIGMNSLLTQITRSRKGRKQEPLLKRFCVCLMDPVNYLCKTQG